MKHARSDYNRIQDPDLKIPEGEPVFLLRAQDKVAPFVVDVWALIAGCYHADERIINAAKKQAEAMRLWQMQRGSKIPDMPEGT